MNALNKMIYFLSSKYYTNIKYNNYLLQSLRLMFERITKNTVLTNSLGNVYRNSKWTDLKIQNIKFSFFNQFINLFVLIVLLFLTILFLFKIGYIDLFLLKLIPYKLWYIIYDLFSYIIIFILSLLYTISIKVNHFIYSNMINLFSENKISKTSNNSILLPNKQFLKNEVYLNNNMLLLILNIYKTKNLLSTLEKNENYMYNNKLILNFNKIKNYHLEIKNILYINSKEKFKITKINNFNLLNAEKKLQSIKY